MGEAARKKKRSQEAPEIDVENELDTVSGDNDQNSVIMYDGSEVQVYKCKLRHAARVARAVNILLMGLGVTSMDGIATIDIGNPQVLLSALDMSAEAIMEAMEALTDLNSEDIENLDMDDAVLLLAKVVEVNRDFFSKRVSVALKELLPQTSEQEQTEPDQAKAVGQ